MGVRLRLLVAAALLAAAGCETFSRMGDTSKAYWLPLTVELRFDPSVAAATLDYTDACRQPQQLSIGADVQNAFRREIGLAFERVRVSGAAPDAPPTPGTNGTIGVSFGLSELQLRLMQQQRDRTYPATLTLGGTVTFTDEAGNVLFTKSLRTDISQDVDTAGKDCTVAGIDGLAAAVAEKLARGFKDQLATSPKIRELAQDPSSGRRPMAATPPAADAPKAAVVPAPPVRPTPAEDPRALDDSADLFATPARQNAGAVVIGLSEYREAALPAVPHAEKDAAVMARYMSAALGVAGDRVRALANERALKADMIEALEEWLPRQIKNGGTAIVYMAGGVHVTESGVVQLLPYEAGGAGPRREYSLRRLYDVLAALPAQRILLILDLAENQSGQAGTEDAQWNTLPASLRDGRLVQLVRIASDPAKRQVGAHGALTAAVLKGLRGDADDNADRTVTLGELCRYIRREGTEQARCVPTLTPGDKAAAFALARLRD